MFFIPDHIKDLVFLHQLHNVAIFQWVDDKYVTEKKTYEMLKLELLK